MLFQNLYTEALEGRVRSDGPRVVVSDLITTLQTLKRNLSTTDDRWHYDTLIYGLAAVLLRTEHVAALSEGTNKRLTA